MCVSAGLASPTGHSPYPSPHNTGCCGPEAPLPSPFSVRRPSPAVRRPPSVRRRVRPAIPSLCTWLGAARTTRPACVRSCQICGRAPLGVLSRDDTRSPDTDPNTGRSRRRQRPSCGCQTVIDCRGCQVCLSRLAGLSAAIAVGFEGGWVRVLTDRCELAVSAQVLEAEGISARSLS